MELFALPLLNIAAQLGAEARRLGRGDGQQMDAITSGGERFPVSFADPRAFKLHGTRNQRGRICSQFHISDLLAGEHEELVFSRNHADVDMGVGRHRRRDR